MPRFGWRVTYDNTTVLTDVQNISITRGRREIQDKFSAGRATISGRNLSSLPTIDIGGQIAIEMSYGSPTAYAVAFLGQVADVKITYGFVTSEDLWQIEVEDFLGRLGRAYTTSSFSWSAGINTLQAAQQTAMNATGSTVNISGFGGYTASSLVSAQSLPNTNALDVINTLAATEQAVLYSNFATSPSGLGDAITFVPRKALGALNILAELTDGTDGGAAVVKTSFDQVVFRSLADSFYNCVVVQPQGLAAQESGVGPRTYTMSSYDQTTTQALNLAQYVKQTFDVQSQVPSTVSVLSVNQTNDQMAQVVNIDNSFGQIELFLRGVAYRLFVLGVTITATPEQARFTLNVASSEALQFFILNSTVFGVLDTSKLGF
jgi:hypothetical protein